MVAIIVVVVLWHDLVVLDVRGKRDDGGGDMAMVVLGVVEAAGHKYISNNKTRN